MKKILILTPLLLLFAFVGILLFNQEQIMHPKRRALQAYHYEWLNHPEQHSMKITKFEKHPEVLLVEFDPNVPRSKRATKIQKELLALGYGEGELQNKGTILMFHGKNGRKEDLLPVAERYVSAGFSCILVDLPAHGESPRERLAYAQQDGLFCENILMLLQERVGLRERPFYIWGMSLGGAYAIASSLGEQSTIPTPKALVLVSTFDKLSNVLKGKSSRLFGNYVGVGLYKALAFNLKTFYDFDPEKLDSLSRAKRIAQPVFMMHGKKDELIAYQQGERLFSSFRSKKKVFHLDEEGDHHNILVTAYPFYLKSIAFMLKNSNLQTP